MINQVLPKTKRIDYKGFAMYFTFDPETKFWLWNIKKQVTQILDFKGIGPTEAQALTRAKHQVDKVTGVP